MKFIVWLKNLSNPNSLAAHYASFNTREEAERFCELHHWKGSLYGVVEGDLIIRELGKGFL